MRESHSRRVLSGLRRWTIPTAVVILIVAAWVSGRYAGDSPRDSEEQVAIEQSQAVNLRNLESGDDNGNRDRRYLDMTNYLRADLSKPGWITFSDPHFSFSLSFPEEFHSEAYFWSAHNIYSVNLDLATDTTGFLSLTVRDRAYYDAYLDESSASTIWGHDVESVVIGRMTGIRWLKPFSPNPSPDGKEVVEYVLADSDNTVIIAFPNLDSPSVYEEIMSSFAAISQ